MSGSLKETLCQGDNLLVGMLFVKKIVMMICFFKFIKCHYDLGVAQTLTFARNALWWRSGVGWGGMGGGLSLMTTWKLEKLSIFKAHELSWTASELCTCLIIGEKTSSVLVKSLKKSLFCSPWLLKNNCNNNEKTKGIVISNYSFKYPVISNFAVF